MRIDHCYVGDCRESMRAMFAAGGCKVQTIVSSPPYWGLRDYGNPPSIWGGDLACDHDFDMERAEYEHRTGLGLAALGEKYAGGGHKQGRIGSYAIEHGTCIKCGAWRGALGHEPTPQLFVAHLVEVFALARELLADDGTLWLNLGDSYSGSKHVANLTDFVQRELEGGVLFFGCVDPRGRAAERVHVLIQDKAAPDNVFHPLFAAKRVSIKDGKSDLCQVGGGLDAPISCWASASLGLGVPVGADAERLMDVPKDVRIILTTGELDAEAPFGIAPALSVEDGEASFAVEIPGEPMTEGIASGIATLDAVTLNAGTERFAQVNPIDQPISLLHGADLGVRARRNLMVRKASGEQVTFDLHGGADLRVSRISLCFSLRASGGITPMAAIVEKAKQARNEVLPKQEIGIPEMVKRGLMRDGWICRQTIIWHKPNPMPESVADRCTKAHEYLFLLSKSDRYYFDNEAIKEPARYSGLPNQDASGFKNPTDFNGKHAENPIRGDRGSRRNSFARVTKNTDGDHGQKPQFRPDREDVDYAGLRNKRSVWTVATGGYSGAHFAVFPPALIEPCILAGSRAGDIVFDPFLGSGTTAQVSQALGRHWVGCELNPEYLTLQDERTRQRGLLLAAEGVAG